jgi:hypothetical protein
MNLASTGKPQFVNPSVIREEEDGEGYRPLEETGTRRGAL